MSRLFQDEEGGMVSEGGEEGVGEVRGSGFRVQGSGGVWGSSVWGGVLGVGFRFKVSQRFSVFPGGFHWSFLRFPVRGPGEREVPAGGRRGSGERKGRGEGEGGRGEGVLRGGEGVPWSGVVPRGREGRGVVRRRGRGPSQGGGGVVGGGGEVSPEEEGLQRREEETFRQN